MKKSILSFSRFLVMLVVSSFLSMSVFALTNGHPDINVSTKFDHKAKTWYTLSFIKEKKNPHLSSLIIISWMNDGSGDTEKIILPQSSIITKEKVEKKRSITYYRTKNIYTPYFGIVDIEIKQITKNMGNIGRNDSGTIVIHSDSYVTIRNIHGKKLVGFDYADEEYQETPAI